MLLNFLTRKKKTYYPDISTHPHYDLHTHIIPSVDDGSPNMETSLQMLEKEIDQGVRHIILTSHFRREENDYEKIKAQFQELKASARNRGLEINLYLGSEIYYDSTTIDMLNCGQVFTMAGTRYVLIEFSPSVEFSYLNNAMDELLMAGYYPILAHAERYGCIEEHLERVEILVDKGVYIQINAGSFLKHPKKKKLLALVQDGLVHFIGTDCHRMDWRPVNMQETCQYLAENIDQEDYCRIFFENPQKLLNNMII